MPPDPTQARHVRGEIVAAPRPFAGPRTVYALPAGERHFAGMDEFEMALLDRRWLHQNYVFFSKYGARAAALIAASSALRRALTRSPLTISTMASPSSLRMPSSPANSSAFSTATGRAIIWSTPSFGWPRRRRIHR